MTPEQTITMINVMNVYPVTDFEVCSWGRAGPVVYVYVDECSDGEVVIIEGSGDWYWRWGNIPDKYKGCVPDVGRLR